MGRASASAWGLVGSACIAGLTLACGGCGGGGSGGGGGDGGGSSSGGADAGAESSGGGDAGPFVGMWTRSGSDMTSCQPTLGLFPAPGLTDLTLALGPRAGTLLGTQTNGCTQTLTVSGSAASITPGQQCTTTSAGGVKTVATVVSDTLTLAVSGQSIAESGEYTLVETGGDAGTITCTQTTRGMYTRR